MPPTDGSYLLDALLVPALFLASIASAFLLSGWYYGVRGNHVRVESDAITTPLGRFTFNRGTRVVAAETKLGKLEFEAKPPVSILAVPHAEQALLGELLSLHVNITDLLPAFRDSRLTLVVGLRSEGRFFPLISLSQRRVSDAFHGSDPPHLTLVRALGLYRDVKDVATELSASFIEAFREMGLKVDFD